jgi:site-specific DNA recombinase
MKAACYVRVSTQDQVERFSLPAQRKTLTEHCERNGWPCTIYEDAGISGETISARPDMQRLLRDAEAKRFDVALAIEMERFSRSTDLFDWLTIRQTFRKANVKFGTPAQLFDPDDLEDRFLSLLFGALSAREKEKLLARSMRGKAEATRQGRYVGGQPPLGYYLDGGTLLVNEKEAEIVRHVFGLARAGGSSNEIARTLDREGVPTQREMRGYKSPGKAWRAISISRMLRAGIYAGNGVWKGIPFRSPAIISGDEFEAVRRNRAQAAALSVGHPKRTYLLRGLIWCGACGERMGGETVHGHYRYYSHRSDGKKRHTVRAGPVEEAVLREVLNALRDPQAVLRLAREQAASFGERDEALVRLDALNEHLAKVPEARSRILDAWEEGTIDKAEYKSRLQKLADRKAQWESERDNLRAKMGEQAVVGDEADRLAKIFGLGAPLDESTVGEMITKFGGRVWVEEMLGKEAPRTARTPEEFWARTQEAYVRAVVRKVTVHPDGSLTFEGLLPVFGALSRPSTNL